MTDNEGRELVLKRFYDLRDPPRWIQWSEFDDLGFPRQTTGRFLEQLHDLGQIDWRPLRSGQHDGYAQIVAKINGRGIDAIENPATGAAPQPQEPTRRVTNRPTKRTARTNIGKALLESGEQVQIALAAVISLIDEKLQQLNASPPNSDEAHYEWINEISELEKLRQIVETLQANVHDYVAGTKAESDAVRSAKSFTDGVEDYWTKNHMKILETGVNVGFFLTAMIACSAMGAGGWITTTICGALAGGKPAIEALKAVRGRGSEVVRRVSRRQSQTRK